MEDRRGARFGGVWTLVSVFVLLIPVVPAHGAELYTRTDEFVCGDTKVQAFTTCTEDSHDFDTAICTDQHFIFTNQQTRVSVRAEGSVKQVVKRDSRGRKVGTQSTGLAQGWECLLGNDGFYVHMTIRGIRGAWDELWDRKGRRLASTKGDSREIIRRFYKVWDSKRLPEHPIPGDFIHIQLFKTDRVDP